MSQFVNVSCSAECYVMIVHQHSWGAFVAVFQLSAVGHVVVATGTEVAVNLSRILLLIGGTAGSLAVLHHHPCLTLIQTFTRIKFAPHTSPLAHLPLLAVREVSCSFCSSPTGLAHALSHFPDSLILKMKAVHSFKMSEQTFTISCKPTKKTIEEFWVCHFFVLIFRDFHLLKQPRAPPGTKAATTPRTITIETAAWTWTWPLRNCVPSWHLARSMIPRRNLWTSRRSSISFRSYEMYLHCVH